jgi:hypothetical protein
VSGLGSVLGPLIGASLMARFEIDAAAGAVAAGQNALSRAAGA